jgi:hypothetical protein
VATSITPPAKQAVRAKEPRHEIEAEPVEVGPIEEFEEAEPETTVKDRESGSSGSYPSEGQDASGEPTAARPPRKRKGKKRRKEETLPIQKSNALMACGMLAFTILVVAGFLLEHLLGLGSSRTRGYDREAEKQAEAVLKDVRMFGIQIEHEGNDPQKPIVAVTAPQGLKLTLKYAKPLGAFTKLRRLHIADTEFNNPDLEHLVGLPDLEDLDLSGCHIDDKGADALGKLVHLTHLDLSRTRITDEGLIKLKDLKKLRELKIFSTRAHGDGLQRELPNLKIIGSGTGLPDDGRSNPMDDLLPPELRRQR